MASEAAAGALAWCCNVSEMAGRYERRVGTGNITSTTIMHQAAASNDIEKLQVMLHEGKDADTCSAVCETPLHHAARFGALHAVKLLAQAKADVNARSKFNNTVLQMVCFRHPCEQGDHGGNKEAARVMKHATLFVLLSLGADPSAVGDGGNTAMDRLRGWEGGCPLGILLINTWTSRLASLAWSDVESDSWVKAFELVSGNPELVPLTAAVKVAASVMLSTDATIFPQVRVLTIHGQLAPGLERHFQIDFINGAGESLAMLTVDATCSLEDLKATLRFQIGTPLTQLQLVSPGGEVLGTSADSDAMLVSDIFDAVPATPTST